MKVGDMVSLWDDGRAPSGVVLELRRSAAKILIDGSVKEFNVDQLWVFYENR